MKKSEVRILLETFWSLEGNRKKQMDYYTQAILPHALEAIGTGNPQFIRQLARVISGKEKWKNK